MDIDKYDDYVRGPVREVITVDTKIKSTNKGFAMLSKLGWVEGQPLGLSKDGVLSPLNHSAKAGTVARRAALQTEISEVLRPFYCTVCDKQFQNVAQYDEHTNSYAHHHKIRFREMQNTQRAKQNTPEEQDKRKEKERKREEKELRKIAAAAGVRMTKATSSAAALAPVASSAEPKPPGFKKGGWASIPSVTTESPPSAELPPAPAGWASVASSSDPSHPPSPAPDTISSAGFSTNSVMPSQPRDPSIQEYAHRQLHQPAPAFRTGGWSSIDSTTQLPPLSTSSPDVPALAVANVHRQPERLPSGPASSTQEAVPVAVSLPPPVLPHPQASTTNPPAEPPKLFKKKKERDAEIRENSRSGWQSFQKSGRRK
ncbi:hypothetical protein DFH94DRAFT_681581 [Russula ochroleuca]|uniref:G-patch domain-containing protein n=1 Tax=Russula ochroleuca TaxID=152965 RepID=A0A9P5MXB4_9AGAM|nr:hypothetical protein DFH94DRAFT_681581 [Russula ochroleuca]